MPILSLQLDLVASLRPHTRFEDTRSLLIRALAAIVYKLGIVSITSQPTRGSYLISGGTRQIPFSSHSRVLSLVRALTSTIT